MAACRTATKVRRPRKMALATDTKSKGAPGFGDMFTPKLVTAFREGYARAHLREIGRAHV